MTTKFMMGMAAAAALVSTQAMAAPVAPAGAQSLSISKSVRAGTVSKRGNKLAGPGAIIVGVLAAGVLAGGIIAVSNNDDDADSN